MTAFRELRELQLGVALFNEGNAAVVYAFKIAAIGATTTASFAVIKFFHENHFLGLVNSLVSLEAAFIFTAMYDKGFTIPKSVIELKRKFPVGLQSLHVTKKKDQIRLLERYFKSIKIMAVKVGAFHYLEQQSTPIFLSFCVRCLARLLIVHNRGR